MGMFDSINIPCPTCGSRQDAQSKSGQCHLDVFEMETAPFEVLMDVNRHAPFTCRKCGAVFAVKVKAMATTVLVKEPPHER